MTIPDEEIHEIQKEISDLFKIAEHRIKANERLEGLNFPAVNQLRYVSYHILRALLSDDPLFIKDELIKAKNHCQRAIYDAVETGIIYYLEEIRPGGRFLLRRKSWCPGFCKF